MFNLSVLLAAHDGEALDRLCAAVAMDASLRLVGRCGSGAEAARLAGECRPDVVALDMELPGEDCFSLIGALREACGARVVAMSPAADVSLRALDAGAADFVYLPVGGSDSDLNRFAEDAVYRIMAASVSGPPRQDGGGEGRLPVRLAVVACAGGGPVPLAYMLKRLAEDCPAVLILQKNPGIFADDFVALLSGLCGRAVLRARDGMALEPGVIALAAGECSAHVEDINGCLILRMDEGKKANKNGMIDALLASAAETLGQDAAGVLLSGSGDGYEGLLRLAARGAPAILRNKNALLRELGYSAPGGIAELPLEDAAAFMSRLAARIPEPSSAATRS